MLHFQIDSFIIKFEKDSIKEINPIFGYKPGVLKDHNIKDATEIDMVIGDIFFEAKLTEINFTEKHVSEVVKYKNINTVFNFDLLPIKNNKIQGYQIIRNILAKGTFKQCVAIFYKHVVPIGTLR